MNETKGVPAGKPLKTEGNPKNQARNDRQYVKALARGLEILRCFSNQHPALGTSELAQLTGLPQPTVWRLCYTLGEEGYLVRDGDNGRVRLGAACLALGHGALAAQPFLQTARDQMQILADRFGCAMALAERDGNAMIMTVRVQGSSTMLMNLPVGSRMPIASSVLGWSYLAELPENEKVALMKELAETEKDRWSELEPAIQSGLKFYKTHGYLLNQGFFHPRVISLGTSFRLPGSDQIYSMNIGGPSSVIPPDTFHNEIAPPVLQLVETLRQAYPGHV